MRITILGNNSALPAFGRHPTAQAVTVFGEIILIDCGEGTQNQMQRYGIKWRNLHHILISHLHGDHYFGLPGLVNSMSLLNRNAPLHIHAPAPLQGILEQLLSVGDNILSYPLHFHPLPEGAGLLIDESYYTISCFPVVHRIPCHGFLIERKTRGRKILAEKCREMSIPNEFYESLKRGDDYREENGNIIKNEWVTEEGPLPKKYAFCADTLFTEDYVKYIMDADAIYHESTYLEADRDKAGVRFHCTAMQAAEIAKLAGAKQLLLGHFSSKYKDVEPFKTEAQTIFENVTVTVEGIAYDI